jgi:hypothetical protein
MRHTRRNLPNAPRSTPENQVLKGRDATRGPAGPRVSRGSAVGRTARSQRPAQLRVLDLLALAARARGGHSAGAGRHRSCASGASGPTTIYGRIQTATACAGRERGFFFWWDAAGSRLNKRASAVPSPPRPVVSVLRRRAVTTVSQQVRQ